jgi:hypothetical protein
LREVKVKKSLLVVFAVFMLVSVASANRTRVATMGMTDIYLWDEENIFWCPALATGYPNELIAEMPCYPSSYEHGDASLGAFLTNDEMASMGVFGLVVNRPVTSVPDTFLQPTPSFDLIYGRNLGGFGLGAMITMARNSSSYSPEDTSSIDRSSMIFGITPGLTFPVGEGGSIDIGLGYEMRSFSDDNKQTSVKSESDGAMGLEAGLRAMLPMGQYVFLIPHFGFGMSKLNWKTTAASVTTEFTDSDGSMFGGGVGVNIMPFEETTVLAGFDLSMMSEENSSAMYPDSVNKTSDMVPMFVFGAESRFNSWMTGRIGASKTFFASHTSENYHGDETSWATDSFQMALGLGMTFGDFNLDVKLHEDFLFTGPEFIGGAGNPPSVMISGEYNFSGM